MSKHSLVMVSYLNSKPFLYGLQHPRYTELFDITLATPSECAKSFLESGTEIALIPVGALSQIGEYKMVTPYCIGCDGEVRTVCVFSQNPIEHQTKLYLDEDSRTSVLLTKILFAEYLKLSIDYQHGVNIRALSDFEATLLIGDKVFDIEDTFRYKYDLGLMWKNWLGLPLVFAVWVTKPTVSEETINALTEALKYGISHTSESIQPYEKSYPHLKSYFRENIDYDLNDEKLKSLQVFFEKSQKYI